MLKTIKYLAQDTIANEFWNWGLNQVKLTIKLTLYPLRHAAQGTERLPADVQGILQLLELLLFPLDKIALGKHHQNVNLRSRGKLSASACNVTQTTATLESVLCISKV